MYLTALLSILGVLAGLCNELEALCRTESILHTSGLVTQIENEYESVKTILTAELKRRAG